MQRACKVLGMEGSTDGFWSGSWRWDGVLDLIFGELVGTTEVERALMDIEL